MRVLLVIDMLEDFFSDGPLLRERSGLVAAINRLVSGARSQGIPVIWVRQEFADDLSDAFPVMRKRGIRKTMAGTPGARILHELDRRPTDGEIVKKRYSAFFGTDLSETLREMDVTHLILAGVNTHACVRMTAIDAYQRDLEVVIPVECVASHDAEHHAVTLNYLGDEIVELTGLENLLTTLQDQ